MAKKQIALWSLYPLKADAQESRLDFSNNERPANGIVKYILLWRVGTGRDLVEQWYQPSEDDIQKVTRFHTSEDPRLPDWLSIRAKLIGTGKNVLEVESMSVLDVLASITTPAPVLPTGNKTALISASIDTTKLERAMKFIDDAETPERGVKTILIAKHIKVEDGTFRKHYSPALRARGYGRRGREHGYRNLKCSAT